MAETGTGFSVFELRPLNLADLLDAVIRIYRTRFVQLLSICAVIALPLGVLQVIATTSLISGSLTDPETVPLAGLSLASILGLLAYGVLFWLTMPLMQAAVAKAVAQYYLGAEATVGAAYRFALRKWLTLLAIMFIIGLATSAIALVVMIPLGAVMAAMGTSLFSPGDGNLGLTLAVIAVTIVALLAALVAVLYVAIKLYFAGLVAVLEDTDALTALRRSWSLTGGHLLRVLLTVSLLWLMLAVARGIVVWPAQAAFMLMGDEMVTTVYALIQGISALAQLVTQPLMVTGTVLLYYDLRIRKEGFDLAAMAEAIGEPELAQRTRGDQETAALFGGRAAPLEEVDDPEDQHPVG